MALHDDDKVRPREQFSAEEVAEDILMYGFRNFDYTTWKTLDDSDKAEAGWQADCLDRAKMMKIELKEKYRDKNYDDRYQFLNWKSALPFLENSRAVLIHRPKSVATVAKSAIYKYPYFVASMWCGATFTNDRCWTFLEAPPDGKIICARCEAMAVGQGLPSSDSLVGRHVHIGGVKAYVSCCKNIEVNDD